MDPNLSPNSALYMKEQLENDYNDCFDEGYENDDLMFTWDDE